MFLPLPADVQVALGAELLLLPLLLQAQSLSQLVRLPHGSIAIVQTLLDLALQRFRLTQKLSTLRKERQLM